MEKDISALKSYWTSSPNKASKETRLSQLTFDEVTNSLLGVGPFYFYIVDFYDMSIHKMSSSVYDFHGYVPATTSFEDILNAMHPEDIDFVVKAEAACLDFMFTHFNDQQKLSYKMSYHFRAKIKDGSYALINHQALILTLDDTGGFGKSLNIHTNVQHINSINPHTFSLIGLNGRPSYLNVPVPTFKTNSLSFSKRELEVLSLIANGLSTQQIADSLFISALTVKKHRSNMLKKAHCKNVSQLIRSSVRSGLL